MNAKNAAVLRLIGAQPDVPHVEPEPAPDPETPRPSAFDGGARPLSTTRPKSAEEIGAEHGALLVDAVRVKRNGPDGGMFGA